MSSMGKGGQKATVWFVIGFLVVAVVVIIVAAVASGGNTIISDVPAPPITENDRTRGSEDAQVTLIEYGDFQCPACASYYPMVERLLEEYGDRILFAARDFPLYSIHPNAEIAAQAAEAAGLQDRYWEMYGLLYERQGEWNNTATARVVDQRFRSYAESLGLDVEGFVRDINTDQVLRMVRDDVASGERIGVNSTPTFYLNLQEVRNPANYEQLKSIIDAALEPAV